MPSGKWRVRWRDDFGNLRQQSFDTKRAAQNYSAQVTTLKASGSTGSLTAGRTPLGDIAALCKTRRWEHKEPATANRYVRTWNLHIAPYLGAVPVERIRAATIEDWQIRLKADGVGADGRRRALSLLRSILARAVEWEYVSVNRAIGVPMPPRDEKRSVRPVSPSQVEAIVGQMEREQDRQLVRLLAYAGLRPGEALALTSDRVKASTLLIEQANANGRIKPTKTRKVRSVELLPPLAASLKSWLMESGTRGLLFPRFDGEPWTETDYRNWCRRIFTPAAPSGVTPYTLRHSFASLLIHAGEPVTYVASQLGHAPSMTLDTYAHVFADLQRGETFDPAQVIAEAMQTELRGMA